jgi:deoxyribodipyrimidine photo-lyase
MSCTILWFRQDLRLSDNPALLAALKSGLPVLPVYILDDENAADARMGGASRFWLHHSLTSLNESLDGHLHFYKGDAKKILGEIVEKTGAASVFWNRCYEPWRMKRDAAIKKKFIGDGLTVESFQASLLWEPPTVNKGDGTPYKVFTPYYRRGCLGLPEPRPPHKRPKEIKFHKTKSLTLNELNLLPSKPRWDKKMEAYWDIGENGAQKALKNFLKNGLAHYKEGRNVPSEKYTSQLSPYLHFGEISPHQAWHQSQAWALDHKQEKNLDTFHSELGWREFSYYLLYHFNDFPSKPWSKKFAEFPWPRLSQKNLQAWQKGLTGYPIVDAGMRELWETGYMHNRIRMVTASFLIKHLRINWTIGEEWFWDCLNDADLASNSASWQWVAGCGADAAPYFRIFNPVLQGEKFDGSGLYVRKWVPELKNMPDKYIHKPWMAPVDVLRAAGVDLGKTYPHPLVDHNDARESALEAYKQIK